MTTQVMTLEELDAYGIKILMAALGPSDTMRFLRKYRSEVGNYTQDHERILEGMSVQDICNAIRTRKSERQQTINANVAQNPS
jgi:hypothetical protein